MFHKIWMNFDQKYINKYEHNGNLHEEIINFDYNNIKKFACGGHPSGRLLRRRAVSDGPLRGG